MNTGGFMIIKGTKYYAEIGGINILDLPTYESDEQFEALEQAEEGEVFTIEEAILDDIDVTIE